MKQRYVRIAFVLVALSSARVLGENDLSRLVELSLARAGENVDQLREALDDAPEDQKEGVRFLVAHMPQRDSPSVATRPRSSARRSS